MKTILFLAFMFVLIIIYASQHKETTKILTQHEITIPVTSMFYPKESTEDPNDTCYQLEWSKRSFHNDKKFNEKTKFEIVRATDDYGNECVRKILADGQVIEEPLKGEHCISYKIPPIYSIGRSAVKVYDFCI